MMTAIGTSLSTVVTTWTPPPVRTPSRFTATNSQIRPTAISTGGTPPSTGRTAVR